MITKPIEQYTLPNGKSYRINQIINNRNCLYSGGYQVTALVNNERWIFVTNCSSFIDAKKYICMYGYHRFGDVESIDQFKQEIEI